jgi:TetR/AcrR family transcriptional regulator, transcriptional repressor for nem operon
VNPRGEELLTDQSRTTSVTAMPRPREFDVDAALAAAMTTFWERGYAGASLSDLTAATGVGRQSLYLAFGDKQALYLAALDRYRAVFQVPLLEALRGGGDIRQVLRAALVSLIDGSCGPVESGCLLVNAATERSGQDQRVRRRVAAAFEALEDALVEALDRAAEAGALPAGRDHRAQARLITTVIQGLRVVAAVNDDPRMLRDTIDTALAVLD